MMKVAISESLSNASLLTKTILFISLFGIIGELILIGHYRDMWQVFSLIYTSTFFVSILVFLKVNHPIGSLILKCLAYGIMLLGFSGVLLHLRNNYAFEFEMYPNEPFFSLLMKSFSGALPVLAPGSLIPVGLVFLLSVNLKSNNYE